MSPANIFARTLLLVSLLAVPAEATGASCGLGVGQVFPEIALPSLEDGTPTSLAQFRGQKVILHIFASW